MDDEKETVCCMRCAAFGVGVVLLAIVLVVLTTPAHAQSIRTDGCQEVIAGEVTCKVPAADLGELIESNNRGWVAAIIASNRVAELEKELEETRALVKTPQCARVDPVPKPLPRPPKIDSRT